MALINLLYPWSLQRVRETRWVAKRLLWVSALCFALLLVVCGIVFEKKRALQAEVMQLTQSLQAFKAQEAAYLHSQNHQHQARQGTQLFQRYQARNRQLFHLLFEVRPSICLKEIKRTDRGMIFTGYTWSLNGVTQFLKPWPLSLSEHIVDELQQSQKEDYLTFKLHFNDDVIR